MDFGRWVRKERAIIQSRVSPVSQFAIGLTVGLAIVGLVASFATKFVLATLPNVMPLVLGVVGIDILCAFAPQTRIVDAVRTIVYGVLYLVTTILCGILAAYSMQRFAFPLEDHFLTHADLALGFNWLDYARWVDRHDQVQKVYFFAYNTLQIQIALPLVILAFSNRLREARIYVLAFAIAFTATIFISALMPAGGPIVFVDRAAFHLLHFTGATPIDQLMRLREPRSFIMTDSPGGIATFPSFHATIAILTPLSLRSHRRIFVGLLVLDAAMLGSTITEGAHYFTDIVAGIAMAFFAYALAKRIISGEKPALGESREEAGKALYPAAAAGVQVSSQTQA